MTTTAASTTETNVPHYAVGDKVDPDVPGWGARVKRVEGGPADDQTVWLRECPSWCVGHAPAEAVEDIADYDWTEHTGEGAGVRLPGLTTMSGVSYREGSSWSVDVSQVVPLGSHGWQLPLIELSGKSDLTASEARSLAAMLVRLADKLEGGAQ